MQQQLGKYLFEVIVIFIGITLGFIFDEWREQRKEEAQQRILFESIQVELLQTKVLLQKTDTINLEFISNVQRTFHGETLKPDEILEGFEILTTDFYVNLSGVLNTLRSITEQNSTSLSNNSIIAQNISFINSISVDHNQLVSEMRTLSKEKIYPVLIQYSLMDDLIAYKLDKTSRTGNYDGLLHDKNFRDQIKLIYIKRMSLSTIYSALIRDIDRIRNEIEKELNNK